MTVFLALLVACNDAAVSVEGPTAASSSHSAAEALVEPDAVEQMEAVLLAAMAPYDLYLAGAALLALLDDGCPSVSWTDDTVVLTGDCVDGEGGQWVGSLAVRLVSDNLDGTFDFRGFGVSRPDGERIFVDGVEEARIGWEGLSVQTDSLYVERALAGRELVAEASHWSVSVDWQGRSSWSGTIHLPTVGAVLIDGELGGHDACELEPDDGEFLLAGDIVATVEADGVCDGCYRWVDAQGSATVCPTWE